MNRSSTVYPSRGVTGQRLPGAAVGPARGSAVMIPPMGGILGLSVQGEPGAGLRGISAADDNGIELSLIPDWYSGKLILRANGGCVRHDSYRGLEREDDM